MGDIYDFEDDEEFDFRKEHEKRLRRYRELRQKLEETFPDIVEYIDLLVYNINHA